jgi:enoyl-CoA hydratase/carnithine racemase
MAALIQARLDPTAAHEAMTTGRRYGGADAAASNLVAAALPEADLMGAATSRATELASTAGPTLAAIRSQMYEDAISALTSS